MRLNKRECLGLFAGLLVAVPIWAAHSNSIAWNVSQPTTIGGTEIKPGDYVLRVDDGGTQVEVLIAGKWSHKCRASGLSYLEKAQSSEVDVDGGKVTQIKIGGKTSAVSFQ